MNAENFCGDPIPAFAGSSWGSTLLIEALQYFCQ